MTLTFEPDRGFGIYIHWPFCQKICPYCDFNVYAAKSRNVQPLLEAILSDLKYWHARIGDRKLTSIFLGGGTPSLLVPDQISDLIRGINELWLVEKDTEISLEANPDDLENFAGFRTAGVNRLSLGVQSLNERALQFLGRNHSANQARDAAVEAKRHFDSVSLDFIYALPHQSMKSWLKELEEIIELKADHLSLYELTIEPRTAFGKAVGRGEWKPADEDICADLYQETQTFLEARGYPAYEISNHAKSQRHQSKHNIVYWQSGDWLGVGPGAHGRLTINGNRLATLAPKRPEIYINSVINRDGWEIETLSTEDVAAERVLMGLRMVSGIQIGDYERIALRSLNKDKISEFLDDGLVHMSGDILRLTQEGQLLADYVSRQLMS